MKLTDNTLKYLKEYGGLSFGERPFSHVDSLILCQLSYFKFQDLVPDLVEKMDGNDIRGVTMRSLRKHPKYDSLYVSDWYEKDNRRLYAAVARSRRFAKMRLNYYTNLTDKEMQMQFSAVTFLLEDGTVYVAFRGTDETIVGWREDFDMALKSPIPSQTAAKLYLRHIAAMRQSLQRWRQNRRSRTGSELYTVLTGRVSGKIFTGKKVIFGSKRRSSKWFRRIPLWACFCILREVIRLWKVPGKVCCSMICSPG